MKPLELKRRSFVKALSYRFCGTLVTSGITYCLTQELSLSLAAGAMDAILKIVIFYFHERAWAQVKWGQAPRTSGVILLTGLSGAGKSALAEKLCESLQEGGFHFKLLDGDVIRSLFKDIGFSRDERIRHLSLMAYIASQLEKQGTVVVCTFIAPYEEARKKFREQALNYIEVWVDTPLAICEARDTKGLYAKARLGQIAHFTGISDEFEIPQNSHIRIETKDRTLDESFEDLKQELKKLNPDLFFLR